MLVGILLVGRTSMAYLRYGSDSDWHVFRYSDKAEAEEEARTGHKVPKTDARLAIWHSDHRAVAPMFTYAQVRSMLDADDFSQVPGFEPSYRDLIRGALSEFVSDVDAEYRT